MNRGFDISLTADQIARVFPFHFAVDAEMRLVEVGVSLAKLAPELVLGQPFERFMRLSDSSESPSFASLLRLQRSLSVIQLLESDAVLRGQFKLVAGDSALLFIGSPWLTDPAALDALGLSLSDFAIHDAASDMLHLMQAQTQSLADARRLADVLTKQRQSLRQSNERLAAQEAEARKLAMIADRTDNAVILTDAQGRIEWVNDGFVRLSGFTLESAAGRTPGACLQGPDTDPVVVNRMREAIRTGVGFREQILNYSKQGREYWVMIEAEPIKDSQGNLTHFMSIQRDITNERMAEGQQARLQRLNEITRQIIQTFLQDQDLTRCIDLILSEVGAFLGVSRAYLFRYRQDLQRLTNTHEWCAQGVQAQAHCLQDLSAEKFPWWMRQLSTGEPIILQDADRQAPDEVAPTLREQRIKALLAVPVFINGQLQAFIGFDDTRRCRSWRSEEIALLCTMVESLSRAIERRIAERERAAAAAQLTEALKQAESANRLKTTFLAHMSHELRTPMTAITGFAKLLVRDAGNPQDRHQWAESIHRNAGHLLALLNDLLDISKIEAGQLSMVSESCNPVDTVSEAVRQLRPGASEKALSLEIITESPPAAFQSDRLRLRQIIFNLISNAIRYTDKGHVRIRLATTLSHRCEQLHITVADTGLGIPTDMQAQVFLPCACIHEDAQRRGGGVGLGLNISRRLAELLGGTITFKSTFGVGSEFVLSLPLHPETAARGIADRPTELSTNPVQGQPLHGRHILVVEDNPDNRRLLQYVLTDAGATVTLAENGQQACDLCIGVSGAGSDFDVIIMDMQMPVMDGYQATECLRSAGLKTPILALTAFALADDRNRCLRAGCDDYLSKPLDETALIEKLAGYAGSRTPDAAPASKSGHQGSLQVGGPQPSPSERQWLADLTREFRASLPGVHAELLDALRKKDYAPMARIAHRLRGVAANFELPSLSEVSAQFEDEFRRDSGSLKLPEIATHLCDAVANSSQS